MKVTSYERPLPLTIEKNWNGKLLARLVENITEERDDFNDVVVYTYDEYIYDQEDYSERLARMIRDQPSKYLQIAKSAEEQE